MALVYAPIISQAYCDYHDTIDKDELRDVNRNVNGIRGNYFK
jgi:hypothetical protein